MVAPETRYTEVACSFIYIYIQKDMISLYILTLRTRHYNIGQNLAGHYDYELQPTLRKYDTMACGADGNGDGKNKSFYITKMLK